MPVFGSPAISGILIGGTPSLAVFSGKPYCAFQANDGSHQLFVTSTSDGANWVPATGYPGIAIGSSPGMTTFNNALRPSFQANDSSDMLFVTAAND